MRTVLWLVIQTKTLINDDTEEFKNMLAECVVDKYYEETNVAKDESKEDEEVTDEEITYNMNSVYCEMEDINLGTIIFATLRGLTVPEAIGFPTAPEIPGFGNPTTAII